MRWHGLRLAGAALGAATLLSAGCGGDRKAPDVDANRGTAASTDTSVSSDTSARSDSAPPVNTRTDTSAGSPEVDTMSSRTRRGVPPPAQAARTDSTPATPKPTAAAAAAPDTGTKRSTASSDTASGSGGTAKPGKVTQVEYTGWKQYEVNCARCHGEYGLGSTIAPSLYHSFKTGAVDSAEFQRVVRGSRMAKGMPSWSGVLSDEYLHGIYKYLSGRGAGRIPAGRPIPEG
jgi:mono/diheme cytochrome c family protein